MVLAWIAFWNGLEGYLYFQIGIGIWISAGCGWSYVCTCEVGRYGYYCVCPALGRVMKGWNITEEGVCRVFVGGICMKAITQSFIAIQLTMVSLYKLT